MRGRNLSEFGLAVSRSKLDVSLKVVENDWVGPDSDKGKTSWTLGWQRRVVVADVATFLYTGTSFVLCL